MICFTLVSCLGITLCPEEISGKFVCKNNLEAENYLLLNDDGTFEHVYKLEHKVLTHKGTYTKRSDMDNCVLEFTEWNNYNEKGENFSELGNAYFMLNGKYLEKYPDGDSSSKFEKIND